MSRSPILGNPPAPFRQIDTKSSTRWWSRTHTSPWQSPWDSEYTSQYSNKGPTKKSDGTSPTTYYNKQARLMSLLAPEWKSSPSWKRTNQRMTTSCGGYGFNLYGSPYGSFYSNAAVSIPQWMTDKVVQECMIDLMDIRSNLLEDAIQARQTAQMVVTILTTIAKLYRMARKGQWRALRRTFRGMGYRPAKKASNGWLMYYYGIRPLVSTVNTLIADIGKPKRKLVSAKRKFSIPVDPSGFVTSYPGTKFVSNGSAFQRVMCGMSVYLNLGANAYGNALGLTGVNGDGQASISISDAVVTAWAVIPYSFVVDWFLPIERYLRTLTWTSAVDYSTGYISKTLTCQASFNSLGDGNDSGLLPRVKVRATQFNRTVYMYTPPSGLSFRLDISPTNLVNLYALMISKGGRPYA